MTTVPPRAKPDRAQPIVVVPTFRRAQTESVLVQLADLQLIGEVVIVANSSESAAATAETGATVIDRGKNLGFGAAVNIAADGIEVGLVVLNDDVVVTTRGAQQIRTRIDASDGSSVLLFHGTHGEHDLGPPTALGTLFRTSGLWMFRRFLPEGRRGRAAPFYAAYVGAEVWGALGGFDVVRYPLYFEDADLLARATAHGVQITQHEVDISSATSQTSRYYTETIWCAAIGARNYLIQHHGWTRRRAATAIRAALAIRAVIELLRRRRAASSTAWSVAGTPSSAWLSTLPAYD